MAKKQLKIFTFSREKAYVIESDVTDPDKDKLIYKWQILESEIGLTGSGGDAEKVPDPVRISFKGDKTQFSRMEKEYLSSGTAGSFTFRAPTKTGGYRLFVYASDGNGNIAAANVPFYVR